MIRLIKVLIVDDHDIVRQGLRAVINAERDMELVGEAADGEEAVQKTLALKPDLVLMDLLMPRMNGIDAIRKIKQTEPQARILVLTSYSDEQLVFSAIAAGALGYLLKDTSAEQLPEAIRCICRGEPSVDPAVSRKLVLGIGKGQGTPPEASPLTPREIEVVKLVARGLANQAIADQLCVAERTIRFHIGNILAKLQLENRTEIALYAMRRGLVYLGD